MNYIGKELQLFAQAEKWKSYWSRFIPLHNIKLTSAIEVGSGIGSNSKFISRYYPEYLGIEPDLNLVTLAKNHYNDVRFEVGTSQLIPNGFAGCILYIDVLEHIQDDYLEIQNCVEKMSEGSFLFILVPANMDLFSNFDDEVGHFRRYSKKSLLSIMPNTIEVISVRNLDVIGYLVLKISKFLRLEVTPTDRSVKIWDFLIPLSSIFDKLLNYRIGKSLILVGMKVKN